MDRTVELCEVPAGVLAGRRGVSPAEAAYRMGLANLQDTHVGIVVVGNSQLVPLEACEMGTPIPLGNNELLYHQTNTMRLPGGQCVTRVITRVENVPGSTPHVPPRCAFAVLVPRSRLRADPEPLEPANDGSNQTIGAKWIPLLPLKYFSQRADGAGEFRDGRLYAPDGHQVMLPSSVTIVGTTKSRVRPKGASGERLACSVTAGYHRYVMAGAMLGSHAVPDAKYTPVEHATMTQWITENASRREALLQHHSHEDVFDADTATRCGLCTCAAPASCCSVCAAAS